MKISVFALIQRRQLVGQVKEDTTVLHNTDYQKLENMSRRRGDRLQIRIIAINSASPADVCIGCLIAPALCDVCSCLLCSEFVENSSTLRLLVLVRRWSCGCTPVLRLSTLCTMPQIIDSAFCNITQQSAFRLHCDAGYCS